MNNVATVGFIDHRLWPPIRAQQSAIAFIWIDSIQNENDLREFCESEKLTEMTKKCKYFLSNAQFERLILTVGPSHSLKLIKCKRNEQKTKIERNFQGHGHNYSHVQSKDGTALHVLVLIFNSFWMIFFAHENKTKWKEKELISHRLTYMYTFPSSITF